MNTAAKHGLRLNINVLSTQSAISWIFLPHPSQKLYVWGNVGSYRPSIAEWDWKGSGGRARGGAAVTNAIYNYLGIGNETVDARGRERERDRAAHFVSLTRSYLALRCVPGKVMMARSWMVATSPYMQRELSFVRKAKYPNALAKTSGEVIWIDGFDHMRYVKGTNDVVNPSTRSSLMLS